MNADLKKKAKNDFEKDFFKLVGNAVFRKTIEIARKNKNFKLVTTEIKETIWFQDQIIILQSFSQKTD